MTHVYFHCSNNKETLVDRCGTVVESLAEARDHAAVRLGPGERDLDLGIALDQAKVGKHLAHLGGAEGVAEKDGVENGGRGRKSGHRGSLRQSLKVSRRLSGFQVAVAEADVPA